ncbi:Ca2+-binding RTX toxin-like protein [Sphingopyxis panaciterrae]|uniref:calcium-binding protein n=1 Tax=Sphingopyxis panaciterrae TaxID=363841 RepID=UPI00142307A1|nr:calcium-binding protein [Sphingopyxis panaciterrae]NIJ39525.1 Ca2+-binding RTX toxin-like protein [Sphingopyxis panaciterrae]
MPVINGIEFWISDDFVKSTSAPNSPSTPWIVNGNDYSDLYAIVSTLNDLFLQPNIRDYLDGLPPKIYITKDDYKVSDWSRNAAWLPNSAVTISASTEFYSDLPKVTYVDPDGSGPAGPVEQVDNGARAPLNTTGSRGHIDIAPDVLSNPSQVFKFNKIDGSDEWADFRRVLFHELAHGQTRVVNTTNWRVGSSNFIVPEALAIDAENLVYRRAFGGAVRVGHIDVFSSSSNDPTASFKNADGISFSTGAYGSGSNEAAIIKQEVGNDAIEKIYGEAAFSISTDSTYAVGNYILIKATDGDGGTDGILTAGGVPTDLLSTVLNGIAHDGIISSNILSSMGDQIDGLNDLGDELKNTLHPSLYRLQEFAGLFSNVKYNEVLTAIGFSAERSLSDSDWTGPYEGTSTAKELFIEAVDGPSLLIGASGTNKVNVNFDNRTDYLRGSDSNDVLIAGTGSRSEKYNVLEGKAGDDILVGRNKDDKLLGGEGNDILFLSLGDDIVDGGPAGSTSDTDTVIVDDGLGAITVDLKVKEDGGSAVSFGGSKSIIKNIDVYVGNASRTTFKGNAEGTVFISGSGGGDFYLLAGDQGIGRSGAQDNFYLDATVPAEFSSWTSAQKISYLETNKVYIGNFGPEDKIYIKKSGTYVLFNGNRIDSEYRRITDATWDRNADMPAFITTMSGDSSYGTTYANPTFEVAGTNGAGKPFGGTRYQDGEIRDVGFNEIEPGLAMFGFSSRSITALPGDSSYMWGGIGSYEVNPLSESDEQLTVVISGFNNGDAGITFENSDGNGGISGPMPGSEDLDRYFSGPQELNGSADPDELQGGWANDTLHGNDGDDYLVGGPGDDLLDGGAGDDFLFGNEGNDTLIGGTGSDRIYGGDGDDVLTGGDGDDHLYGQNGGDTIDGGDGTDVAYLSASIYSSLIYRKLDGTVVVENYYDPANVQTITNVETLSFDGDLVNVADLPMGTGGNDVLTGSSDRSDLLDGGAGDDTMAGGDFNDVYVVDAVGDVVIENANEGTDTVRTTLATYSLGSNIEGLVFTGAGAFVGTGNELNNQITGGAGNDTLSGGDGDDRFSVIGGTDTVDGGDGEDVVVLSGTFEDYTYSIDGLGVTTITDGANSVQLTNVEQVEFKGGGGFSVSDLLTVFVTGTASNDIIEGDSSPNTIRGLGGDDSLRGGAGGDVIDGGDGQDTAYFSGNSDDYEIYQHPADGLLVRDRTGSDGADWLTNVEMLHFDGDNVTINVSAIAPVGTDGDDLIYGSARNDRLYGFGGNDFMTGADGDDNLEGGAGDDTLDSGSGDDLLYGGVGDDTNILGTGDDFAWDVSGNDSYIYELGDGTDRIRDDGGTDAIILGSAITPGDVTFSVDGEDILINFASGGSLTIENGLVEGSEIEEIRFGDSTVWNPVLRLQTPTSGNDNLIGTISADTISGGAGNDMIEGRQGNDTLSGDSGDDILSGGAGDDSYLFALGDGTDVIQDASSNYNYGDGGNDTLIFGSGIAPIDVQVTMVDNSDLVLTIAGAGGQVTLKNSVLWASDSIETVQFSDTTVWTHADLMSKALAATSGDDALYGSFAADTISGGAGNDYINAREGDDILTGGLGNDNITGGAGNDSYYFNLGDGQDYISDYTNDVATSLDKIVFGAGILPADIIVAQADSGWDLVLSIAGTSDKITINDAAFATGYRIEEIHFADSTVWTHGDLMARAYGPRSTGDTYWGTSAADTISGGAGNDMIIAPDGNDTLTGGAGNDLFTVSGDGGHEFFFGVGDGNDTLTNPGSGYSRTDNLQLVDLDPSDISLLRNGDQLQVKIISTGETFSVTYQFWGGGQDYGLGQISFADETIWNRSEIGRNALMLGTAGADNITLPSLAFRVRPGGGNDSLSVQGTGSGIIEFSKGDGHDLLDNPGSNYVRDDTLLLRDILPTEVSLLREGNSLTVTVDGTGDTFKVKYQFWTSVSEPTPHYGINKIEFADGTIWDRAFLTDESAGSSARSTATSFLMSENGGTAIEGTPEIGEVAVVNNDSHTHSGGTAKEFVDTVLAVPSAPPANISVRDLWLEKYGSSAPKIGDGFWDGLRSTRSDALNYSGDERGYIRESPRVDTHERWSGARTSIRDVLDFAKPSSQPAQTMPGPIDRQLAIMIQNMGAFGAQAGGEGLANWQRDGDRPIDFFA